MDGQEKYSGTDVHHMGVSLHVHKLLNFHCSSFRYLQNNSRLDLYSTTRDISTLKLLLWSHKKIKGTVLCPTGEKHLTKSHRKLLK